MDRGTNIDNQEFLSEAIGLTLLQERINNTAFILKGCEKVPTMGSLVSGSNGGRGRGHEHFGDQ